MRLGFGFHLNLNTAANKLNIVSLRSNALMPQKCSEMGHKFGYCLTTPCFYTLHVVFVMISEIRDSLNWIVDKVTVRPFHRKG